HHSVQYVTVHIVDRERGVLRIEHRLQRTSPIFVRDRGPISLQATARPRGRHGIADAVVPIQDGATCIESECLDVLKHVSLFLCLRYPYLNFGATFSVSSR